MDQVARRASPGSAVGTRGQGWLVPGLRATTSPSHTQANGVPGSCLSLPALQLVGVKPPQRNHLAPEGVLKDSVSGSQTLLHLAQSDQLWVGDFAGTFWPASSPGLGGRDPG